MSVLRGLLLDNLGLKLVALLLAVLVYLHVFTERPATMIVSFPIQYADLPDSLSLSGALPETVQAELRGTGKQFIRLWLTEPRFKVSLAGMGVGRFDRPMSEDDLPLIPSDRLEVQRLVSPDVLSLTLERKVARNVPVAARAVGTPRSDWDWEGAVLLDPPVVLVRGPQRAVAALDTVVLETVSIEAGRDTVRVLAKPAELPRWCVMEPPKVWVAVPLARRER